MANNWHFCEQRPADPIRNPISGEFFSTEAVSNAAEAIVREGIQNSLDARIDRTSGRAEVRIYLSETANALSPAKVRLWFSSLWPHIKAHRNGLRNQPDTTKSCQFVCFEDFKTTGLTGDASAHQVVNGAPNHFLNFFRAEGYSDKGEHDRGSWGVGKTVFPRASRISTFFGLTVRDHGDGKGLLLGRSILKFHEVDGKSFKSDGYFGVRRDDDLVEPCEDEATLDEFRRDFKLRRQHEPGLPIVVPWCDDDDDNITPESVIHAVVYGFFYPILMGHLSVTIATSTTELVLNSNSILEQMRPRDFQVLPLLELAEWAKTRTETEFQHLLPPVADRAQKWSPDLVPDAVAQLVRQSLDQNNRIALRVPMSVHQKANGPQRTFFDVFLERSDDDGERPVFIRDELIIPGVRAPRLTQVRCLVIVEDKPLAALLRDAENPAHVEWSPNTGNFKDKYKFGPGAIKFVIESVATILKYVYQMERKPDPSITIDFFSLPAPPDDEDAIPAKRRKATSKPGIDPPPPIPPIPRRPARYRIESLPGGFRIVTGDPDARTPQRLSISVAYDVRRGDPLSKYDEADFRLDKPPITYSADDNSVEVESAEKNRMKVVVCKPRFCLDVTGFDLDRDLYVKTKVDKSDSKEAGNVD